MECIRTMNLEDVIKELRIATKTHNDMNKEYGTNDHNHVSIVVECILEAYDKVREQ